MRFLPVFTFVALVFPMITHAERDPHSTSRPSLSLPTKVVSVEGITEYRFDNGLKLLLFPDRSSSKITVNITYFVGSRHEGYGETGMAHLLEHLMFKGTPRFPNIWKLLEDHGARFNGTTWVDRTNYFETFPAKGENLDYVLGLEADRMLQSPISKEDLATEFSVVRNEFEMGENQPVQILEERMMSTAYLWHNYGKSTIGSKSDIEHVPIENLRAFYKRYYQPDNAMLIVAGGFETDDALELAAKHFGALPRPERQLPATYTVEPVQDGERRVVLRRTGDVGAVGILYHGLPGSHEDFVAQEALVHILTNKPAGRLYKALVETGSAAEVNGESYAWAEPGTLEVFATVKKGSELDPVLAKLVDIVEGFSSQPVKAEELERFRARALREIELSLADSSRVGVELSEWAAQGDWRLMLLHRERISKLTADKIQRFAEQFLIQSNRTAGLFIPTDTPQRAPAISSVDVAKAVEQYEEREKIEEGEVLQASLDAIEDRLVRKKLPVGLQLAFVPKKTRGRTVTGILNLHVGSEERLQGRTTAASLLPELLLRGTESRSYQDVQDAFDRLKVEISAVGEIDATAIFRFTTIRDSLPQFLEILAECLRKPALSEHEFGRFKKEKISKLEQYLQDPMALGFSELSRLADPWPRSDVRHKPSIVEKLEDLRELQIEEMRRLYREIYGASRSELVLVGDFDPGKIENLVEQLLGDWENPTPYERVKRPYIPDVPPRTTTFQLPDKAMAAIGVAQNMPISDTHPDYAALKLGNYILGASARSRLLDRLRQKEGISYGAFSSVRSSSFEENAIFLAGAICAPQNANRALEMVEEEIQKILEDGIEPKEFEEAKMSYQQSEEARLTRDRVIASMLADDLFTGRDLRFRGNQLADVLATTPEDLRRVLNQYFEPHRMSKVLAGDFETATTTSAGSETRPTTTRSGQPEL